MKRQIYQRIWVTTLMTITCVVAISSTAFASMQAYSAFSPSHVYESFTQQWADKSTLVAQTEETSSEHSPTKVLDTIIAQVQAYYDSVDDFVADFQQEYTSAALGETRTSQGRVFFKKPGKMRWDYAEPTERYLISNGEQLWIYEPGQGQFFTEKLGESQLPAALRFLMGEGDLRDAFSISLDDLGAEIATLILEPNQPSSQYARLKFVVDRESGAVQQTIIFDAVGNKNQLSFSNVKKNQGLPDSGFEFEAPEGAVQVEAPR